MTARTLAKKIGALALEKKAHNVVLLDVRTLTSTTDFFVICHGDSDTQVRAIADEIRERLNEKGIGPLRYEGFQGSTWIVLDFVDVVAHVFHRESRKFYNLERLWADAEVIELKDEAEEVPPPKKPVRKKTSGSRSKSHSSHG